MGTAEPEGRDDGSVGGLVDSGRDLVVEIARRIDVIARDHHVDPGMTVDALVREGTAGLLQAADRFDAREGVGFPVYATWWIRLAMVRALVGVGPHHPDASASGARASIGRLASIPEFRDDIERLLRPLDGRERALLRSRLGLDGVGSPRTLAEVSRQFGWTRERVRQVEARALSKIRHVEMTDLSVAGDRPAHG